MANANHERVSNQPTAGDPPGCGWVREFTADGGDSKQIRWVLPLASE